jgi:hypothetical protein
MPAGPDVNDAESVSDVITGALLCTDCIAKKTGLAGVRVKATLETIASTVDLRWIESRCDACLSTTKVFRLV